MKTTALAPFLCGALLAASISVMANGRPAAQGSGTWSVTTVDEGSIRAADSVGLQEDEASKKTHSDVTAKIKNLSDQGWEPFAGGVYGDRLFTNEKVYFFRKRS